MHVFFMLTLQTIFFIFNACCIYPMEEKKSLHMQCSIGHNGNCALHHCAAFLWVIHMVAEKIRWRLTQELFQLVRREDLKFLLKFWTSRWRIAVHLPGFGFSLYYHCWQHPMWLENSSTVLWNGLQFYNKGG